MKYLSKLNLCLAFIFLIAIIAGGCEKSQDENQNNLNGKTTAVFNSSKTYGTMTDPDGNVYKTITIGTQTWMAENLRTTKYNDGTSIPNVIVWGTLTTGAYCSYKNITDEVFIATNGMLYNWYAINSSKLAPSGWHIPTIDEFNTLSAYLGNGSLAGGKMKETGTTHWNSQNTGATNESGFTALPSGGRLDPYSMSRYDFKELGTHNYLWSATSWTVSSTLCYVLSFNDVISYSTTYNRAFGLSVRLVKD